METGTLITLALYFLAMIGIGVYAWKTSTSDVSEYMLGGRRLGPGTTALSAGASDMSGWLLLGLPGAMFVMGFSASWIGVGLILGALMNYLLVAPRLRVHTAMADDAITIPDFFEKRFADRSRLLRVFSALIIIIFFTLYTASGMVSGGKLFDSAFGVDYAWGLWITAGVTIVYTLLGGFLAVSLTDVVQGTIMFLALILVPVVAMAGLGGPAETVSIIRSIDPALLSMTAGVTFIGVLSSLAWGLGYFGQPHIIVRFMAIRSVREIPTARNIGMTWMTISLLGALATGVIGLAYATRTGLNVADPETIFIILSDVLFHPLVTGFLLAAILSAVMSTISSQLLVSSSSLAEDFYAAFIRRGASQKELVLIGRGAVLAVSVIAIILAQNPESKVLTLVSNAWAGLGAAFGPLILLSLMWRGVTRNGALAGMLTGAAVVLFWVYVPVLPDGQALTSVVYELLPGFILSTLAIVLVSLTGRPPEAVTVTFDRAQAELKAAGRGQDVSSSADIPS